MKSTLETGWVNVKSDMEEDINSGWVEIDSEMQEKEAGDNHLNPKKSMTAKELKELTERLFRPLIEERQAKHRIEMAEIKLREDNAIAQKLEADARKLEAEARLSAIEVQIREEQ